MYKSPKDFMQYQIVLIIMLVYKWVRAEGLREIKVLLDPEPIAWYGS